MPPVLQKEVNKNTNIWNRQTFDPLHFQQPLVQQRVAGGGAMLDQANLVVWYTTNT